MRNQSVAVLRHYTIIVVTQDLKIDFSYIKILISVCLFNVIDSPDIVLSSKQPKYVTLEYCLISIPFYIILSFPAFFNLTCKPKSMHLVLSSPRSILNLLPTNYSHWQSPYLIDVQLYEHIYVGMLDRNHLHIKANRNERPRDIITI